MPLPDVRGHDDTRALLARAALADQLPQSLLLHGPAGIGKERLGLWIAQLLLCERPSASGPCGECQPCRLVLRLQHPDVHWFFPLPRPDASSADKLREKLEDARHEELARWRENPWRVPAHDKAPALFLATVQALQQHATVRPTMGRRRVFVVGDAEAMVPQESSPEAANAFLKLLEEPPPQTTVVLTSSQPGALLPTIRSRVLPIRLLSLSQPEIEALLVEEQLTEPGRAAEIAAVAEGAVGRALRMLPSGDGDAPLETQRQAARALLVAALQETAVGRLAAAHDARPSGGRSEEFQGLLDAFGRWLRDLLAVAAGAPDQVINRDAVDLLQRAVERYALHPAAVAAALEQVDRTRELALGNVNPQLALAELLRGVQRALRHGMEAGHPAIGA